MGFISLGEAVARVLDRLEAQRLEGKTGEMISLPGKAAGVGGGAEAPLLASGGHGSLRSARPMKTVMGRKARRSAR